MSFAEDGIPVEIGKVADAGRFRIVETWNSGRIIKMLISEDAAIPPGQAHIRFDPRHTQIYDDGWMVT